MVFQTYNISFFIKGNFFPSFKRCALYRLKIKVLLFVATLFCAGLVVNSIVAQPAEIGQKDPIRSIYHGYTPDFVDMIKRGEGVGGNLYNYRVPEESMKLSAETSYYTLSRVNESDRAYALVEAGIQKEREGHGKESIEIYQKILDEYGDILFCVAKDGVFVPISQYVQMRILNLPPDDLAYYRVKMNSRAKEAFELAYQRNSLEGLAVVRDNFLATSYGAPAMLALGMAALDQGRFLEALEYFNTVWEFFPEQRILSPNLALCRALCNKMLGFDKVLTGDKQGLVGYWKNDENSGTKVADASGLKNDGVIIGPADWVPGKSGSALNFSWTNVVSIKATTFTDLGTGGQGFSFAFWIRWERVNDHPDHFFFVKRGSPDEMVGLSGFGKGQIRYTIATQNPEWEKGRTVNGIPLKEWAHVAFVRTPENEVRIYLNGRLELREKLQTAVGRNNGTIEFGRHIHGAMDEIRLYNRPLLDREVAELAGHLGKAEIKADVLEGEVPLPVTFSAVTNAGMACFWEFGDGETACGPVVTNIYGLGGKFTAKCTTVTSNGTIAVANVPVNVRWRPQDSAFVQRMERIIGSAKSGQYTGFAQRPEDAAISAEDYLPWPPSKDPAGVLRPVWRHDLARARTDQIVYTYPVVTERNLLYRHKNIIYCHSLLSGDLLWANDLGGSISWQNRKNRQYPLDGLVVQDSMVFTVMQKVGPSLVALDEVSGQLKWAHGPMAATSKEDALLRFEATPAVGPGTVYASYILDNIEGNTHTDSEYGLMAFESTTGRVKWRREISRLQPGVFTAGMAVATRNKIRSFASPPFYHEGTVYVCTDAGTVAALDALSGRAKWLMRYPYWPEIHDNTKTFGELPLWSGTVFSEGMNEPSLWFNQRPWVFGNQLYILPVDGGMMHCLDRRTGQVIWSRIKGGGNYSYLLGPTSDGYLVLATSGRGGIVHLLDTASGKTLWTSPNPIIQETHPSMTHAHEMGSAVPGGFNNRNFFLAARPVLTTDDRLYTTYNIDCGFTLSPWCISLAEISLRDRDVVNRRKYYAPAYLSFVSKTIDDAGRKLPELEKVPHKDTRMQELIAVTKEIANDKAPENVSEPFMPFTRMTFERFGVPFELRVGARTMEMVYDRQQVQQKLAGRSDPQGLFANAELALGESRLQEAADLMLKARAQVQPEDVDFRAVINQQLHGIYKKLAQESVRAGKSDAELANCLGMSQTVISLNDEIESLLALSEAYARRGNFQTAASLVQQVVNAYGQYEYSIPALMTSDQASLANQFDQVLNGVKEQTAGTLFAKELVRAATLTQKTLGLYFSALSPLKRELRLRSGELGAQRLLTLQKEFPELRAELDRMAVATLGKLSSQEQLQRLWEFPGSATGQKIVEKIWAENAQQQAKPDQPLDVAAAIRKKGWALADAARIGVFKLPDDAVKNLLAPVNGKFPAQLSLPCKDGKLDLADNRGPSWLVLERYGDYSAKHRALAFLGGRIRKKVDNKFLLYCLDMDTGTIRWKGQEERGGQMSEEIRLGDKVDEPGFFKAFVFRNIVVVHGMYDVIAFDIESGTARWHYTVPYGFEINNAVINGDLLFLAGESDTIALYLGTKDPRGEVAWQEKEEGSLYIEPYLSGDRLISVRKLPFNLTVRFRATGKLIGRLDLPDLSLHDENPLHENGKRELPIAHDGNRLAFIDGQYYYMIDIAQLKVVWKRLIDKNDPTAAPPMRMALTGDYLAVVKHDYDVKAIYMLDACDGEIVWHTDSNEGQKIQPFDTMLIRDGKLYGIRPHPGQGFFLVGLDAATGKELFKPNEQTGYEGKPEVQMFGELYGETLVTRTRDRQDFEIKLFSAKSGQLLHALKVKGSGDFGEHGRAGAALQDGAALLLGRNDLLWTKSETKGAQ